MTKNGNYMDEGGFLAENLSEVRLIVRDRYAKPLKVIHEINRQSVATQHLIVIHRDNRVELFMAVLFARTLASTQAAVILLEHGLVAQARTVLRSAMEGLFQLAAITRDRNVVDQILEAHEAEKIKIRANASKWMGTVSLETLLAQDVSGETQAKEKAPRSISVFCMAKKAGLEAWYYSAYRALSWSVHAAASDLQRHLVVDDGGVIESIQNEPEIEDQPFCWDIVGRIQIIALLGMAEIFPNVDKEAIGRHLAALDAAFEEHPPADTR